MPETPFTDYCGKMYRLNQHLHDFIVQGLAPSLDAHVKTRPATGRRFDNAIQVTFSRMIRWLKSVDKLDQNHDYQAVGAAARGMFELYLDLKWFEKFPQPEYLEKFCEYPEVSRYMAARKVVERAKNPQSKLDSTNQAAFMARFDAGPKGPVPDRVAKLWGRNKAGEPKWPQNHWTGHGTMPERTEMLGPECRDDYAQVYPTLCALLHSGPGQEVRDSLSDPVWIEMQMGYGYFFTFSYARKSALLLCQMLGFDISVFDQGLRKLDEWLDEARHALPKGDQP